MTSPRSLTPTPLSPCRCGKPWPEMFTAREYVDACVALLGEYVPITIGTRVWRVSRYCMAYHGITDEQLIAGDSGQEEITAC